MLSRTFWKLACRFVGAVTNVATDEPIAALTFDDGPQPDSTPRILEILEEHGARGTFFVVGQQAQKHPEVLQRISEGGHAIGNHSWDHPSFPLVSRGERRSQVRSCAKVLEAYEARIFRPPYGNVDRETCLDLWCLGYRVITWDVVASDWSDRTAEEITADVCAKAKPGSIVLLHDGLFDFLDPRFVNRDQTVRAVEMILERVGKHLEFVTVPELLRRGRAQKSLEVMRSEVDFLNRLHREGTPKRYRAESA